jgi:hypothetical protein
MQLLRYNDDNNKHPSSLTLKKTTQLFSITNDIQIQLQPPKTQLKHESVFSKLFASGVGSTKNAELNYNLNKPQKQSSAQLSPSKTQPKTAAKIQFTETSVSRNKLHCKVALLDDDVQVFVIENLAIGQELFDLVCKFFELNEKGYFSLTF